MKTNFIFFYLSLAFILPLLGISQGINIDNGSSLVANGNINLVIQNGGFTNNGTFVSGTSTVFFTGNNSTSGSFINGTASTNFYNLTLNKSSNGLQLNSNIGIDNILNLQNGDSLYLNNHVINLSNTATISGETNARHITGLDSGYIQVAATLNGPVSANPGNIGIEITSTANLGPTVIKRYHVQQGGNGVYRYYDISPTNNTGLNATLKFHYFDSELAGIAESYLAFYSSLNNGYTWSFNGKIGIDTILNFVVMDGYNKLQLVTLGHSYVILSSYLSYFKAAKKQNQTWLEWASSLETSTTYFELERSENGTDFHKISQIWGLANNNNSNTYSEVDDKPFNGINYYRLKQVDNENHFFYSDIVMVNFSKTQPGFILAYPNPAVNEVKINVVSEVKKESCIIIFDMNGKPVFTKNVTLNAGNNSVSVNISKVPAGNYSIRLIGDDLKSIKLIKL